MDDDPVLRSLGADLANDDPALAALLRTGVDRSWRRRVLSVLLLAPPLLLAAALVSLRLFGVLVLLLVSAAPLLACSGCAVADHTRSLLGS